MASPAPTTARQTAQEKRAESQARREALQRDMEPARKLREELKKDRAGGDTTEPPAKP